MNFYLHEQSNLIKMNKEKIQIEVSYASTSIA
jgi:hypothetical protein